MTEITLKLPENVYRNLRTLVLAGAKSPHTDEAAVMAAAQILMMMNQQTQSVQTSKANVVHLDATGAS